MDCAPRLLVARVLAAVGSPIPNVSQLIRHPILRRAHFAEEATRKHQQINETTRNVQNCLDRSVCEPCSCKVLGDDPGESDFCGACCVDYGTSVVAPVEFGECINPETMV
jgi:hypothetical protein